MSPTQIQKSLAYLDDLLEQTRHLRLLLNHYQNPPKRYETDYDIRWAKEIKEEQ